MTNKPLDNLQQHMRENQIDFSYIDNPELVAYFSEFESNPHERIVALLIFQEEIFLFVPALEEQEARIQSSVKEVASYKDEENPWEIIGNLLKDYCSSINSLGIEASTLTVSRYNEINKFYPNLSFVDLSEYMNHLKLVKTDAEIEKMKVAGEIADKAIEIGISALEVGITEQEVVAEIEYQLKKLGISEMSFPTMVLFGDHAGSPHGTPGNRKLVSGEFVLFDLGVVKDGYTSDITRTVVFGEISDQHKQIYDVVLQAQLKAQQAVKAGITAEELDQIARNVIHEAGFGEYFTHRLGHGLGKSVHEFPSIAKDQTLKIKEGMCFSIEPGIYIPGEVGIRIEDCVYVTADGCIPFTHTPKELHYV